MYIAVVDVNFEVIGLAPETNPTTSEFTTTAPACGGLERFLE
jgi:hypothetical protein